MVTSTVAVLDLREAPEEQPTEFAGGVVVLDNADSLLRHADVFLSLVGEEMVTGVVCVAIGEADPDNALDGVVLAVPPALRYATVLWVGDPRGVDWALGSAHPRLVDAERDALDDLVAALRVPSVFDRVVTAAEELGGLATNPGVRLVSGGVDPSELAAARATAVRSVCATDRPASQSLAAAVRELDAVDGAEGVVLSRKLAEARTAAVQRLNYVIGLSGALATAKALFGKHRPNAELGSQVRWAGQAAENYRRYLGEALDRVDGHTQAGEPSVEKILELGVPEPKEVRPPEIVDSMREAVDARLRAGVSLFVLARELRTVAATSGPQGCATALAEVRRRGPLTLELPAFRRWPLGLATLPLVALTCLLLAALPGTGIVAGGVLAVGWFAAGWLLLARRPGPDGEAGFGDTAVRAVITYGLAGVVGAVAGVVLSGYVPDVVTIPVLTGQLLALGIVLLAVTVVGASWVAAVRHWRADLRVNAVFGAIAELTRITEDVIVREWRPLWRRRTIAATASAVAVAVEEIAQTLGEAGNQLFVPSLSDTTMGSFGEPVAVRPVPQELCDVVRGDLVDLCRGALEPAWRTAEAELRAASGVYTQRLDQLLAAYAEQVRDHGLLTAPPFNRDATARDALTTRIWTEGSSAAKLRAAEDGDMTQLCRGGQLGYLSTGSPPGLVLFAPQQVRRVLERDATQARLAADPRMTWSHDGELVGALRLVPLRPESVRQVLGGGV
jgi:hypothetical protein